MKLLVVIMLFFMPSLAQANWEVFDYWTVQEQNIVYLKDKGRNKFLFSGYDSSGEFLMVASAPNLKPHDRMMKLDIHCYINDSCYDIKIFLNFYDLDNAHIATYEVKSGHKTCVQIPLNELKRIKYFTWSFE